MTVPWWSVKRTLLDCPECACKFATESDLAWHMKTHEPGYGPGRMRRTSLSDEEYAEKLRLFRLNYC